MLLCTVVHEFNKGGVSTKNPATKEFNRRMGKKTYCQSNGCLEREDKVESAITNSDFTKFGLAGENKLRGGEGNKKKQ